MKKGLQVFKNDLFEVAVTLENGDVLFDVEKVARNLGIIQKKGDSEYIRWERINDYLFSTNGENSPRVGKGDLIPEAMVYKLAFKASNEVAEKFQDWLAIEVIPSIRKTGQYQVNARSERESFDMQLLGAEYAMRLLRVDDTSKIKMLEEVHKQHGVPTNHLPSYVEEEVTKSLTTLLKDYNIGISTAKANTKLIELGILEIKERQSNNGEVKEFKSLTDKGLKYGKNLINAKSPKETQPHYFVSTFKDLVELIK